MTTHTPVLPRRLTWTLLAILAAAVAFSLLPSAASAACPSDHPVYGLRVDGVGCGTALVVASRITQRYDAVGDFRGTSSSVRITQRDGRGRSFRCSWNRASVHGDIVNWVCVRGMTFVGWVWRRHRL